MPTPTARYARVLIKLSGEALAGPGPDADASPGPGPGSTAPAPAPASGVDPESLARMADEILAVHALGVQVGVVVGGGNYFRGRMAEGWGIGRAEADNIGMLGTVMNALMLRGALTGRGAGDVRVMTAVPMQSLAEPFIRLRADRHLHRGLIVLLAGGIGQPYVTTDYPAVQRALELDADALLVAKRGVDGVYDRDPNQDPAARRFAAMTHAQTVEARVKVMDESAFVLASEHKLPMHVFDVSAPEAMRRICLGEDIGTLITTP